MVLRPAVTAGVLAIVALLFYGARLNESPAFLHQDEVAVARQAYAIAQTGRDLNGLLLPLYLHSEGDVWFQSMPVYGAAIAAVLVPSSPVAVRWPSILFGAIAVLLVYRIGLELFVGGMLPVVAAALVLLTPVHYMLSRLAMDGVFAVPFVLASIACVLSYLDQQKPWQPWLAGLVLGVGFYSSTTAPVMMPVYLALAALVLWVGGHTQPRTYARLTIGFLLPLACLAPWFLSHPESYPDTLGRWAIHAAHIRNPVDGLRAIVNWGSLTNRASVYWEFLNPAFLFFPADESSVSATRASGPMLLPLLILVPIGVARIFRRCSPSVAVLILVGSLVAPLAAATFGENHAVARVLVMVPFLAIVATFGVEGLWVARSPAGRVVATLLLILVPVQFAIFHADYLSDYRAETATIFQGSR